MSFFYSSLLTLICLLLNKVVKAHDASTSLLFNFNSNMRMKDIFQLLISLMLYSSSFIFLSIRYNECLLYFFLLISRLIFLLKWKCATECNMSVCPFDVNKVFEGLNKIKIGINLLLIYPYTWGFF